MPHSRVRRQATADAIWLALLVYSAPLGAESFSGKVVRVADGDTLTVLVQQHQVKVRLTEIDAPERGQPFAKRSRLSLAELCAGKVAQVDWQHVDRYQRRLGRVYCSGIDANAEQVRRGMAWVFDQYVTDRSLYQLQQTAQRNRLGLWREAEPMPPWAWRAGHKKAEVAIK